MTTTTTTTATAKKTGWFIRKGKPSGQRSPERNYSPVYIFADGDERAYWQHEWTVEDCRAMIRDHFDNGRKAPDRHTRMTREESAEILYRACLSDPF